MFPTITACLILHNFLRIEGESVEDEDILVTKSKTTEKVGGGGGGGHSDTGREQRRKGFQERENLIKNHFY